jgi:hypothetical protein
MGKLATREYINNSNPRWASSSYWNTETNMIVDRTAFYNARTNHRLSTSITTAGLCLNESDIVQSYSIQTTYSNAVIYMPYLTIDHLNSSDQTTLTNYYWNSRKVVGNIRFIGLYNASNTLVASTIYFKFFYFPGYHTNTFLTVNNDSWTTETQFRYYSGYGMFPYNKVATNLAYSAANTLPLTGKWNYSGQTENIATYCQITDGSNTIYSMPSNSGYYIRLGIYNLSGVATQTFDFPVGNYFGDFTYKAGLYRAGQAATTSNIFTGLFTNYGTLPICLLAS